MRVAVAVLVAVLGGCASSTTGQTGCRTALECGPNRECHVETGRCRCVNNNGCGEGEFCNAAQQCQIIAGCTDNTDCEHQSSIALICDIKRGQCASAEQCFDDSHCKLGQVCEASSAECIPGCRDEADCAGGQGCLRADPNAPLGECRQGACSTTDQCPVGNNCDLTTHTCVLDERGPFCGACQQFDPLNPQCGEPSNYCLIDTGDPARQSHYCGVDCTQEQGCPAGYECKGVIIVGPPATPACVTETCSSGVCSNTGAPCGSPLDCPQGPPRGDCQRARVGICVGSASDECLNDEECGGAVGSCRFAECRLRESAAYGFCTCVVDSDCPADDCRGADLSDPNNPVVGHCLLSGHKCYAPSDCDVIACVNGGCLIGQNCKPSGDRRCVDLPR